MRYKQMVLIVQLLEECGKYPSSENIQKVAECVGISVTIKELDYLAAIAKAVIGGQDETKSI